MTRSHHYRVRPVGEEGTMSDLEAVILRLREAHAPGSSNKFRRQVLLEAADLLEEFGEPIRYRVKDFADGWIQVKTLKEARAEAESAGNLIQAIHVRKVGIGG